MSGARWALVGTVLLLCAELGLRATGSLPSMRARPEAFRSEHHALSLGLSTELPACVEVDTNQVPPLAWRRRLGGGEGPPLRVLFVGDSVTLGRGVEPEQSWASRVGEQLAFAQGRSVEILNAGVNASGYCGAFRMVHHQLAHERFDRIVVGLFADDLVERAVVLEQGQIYANPEAVPGPIGAAASTSYLFNWVWHRVLILAVDHAGVTVPGGGLAPGRGVPTAALMNLAASVNALVDHDPLYFLNSPAGMGYCTEVPAPSDCRWLREDLDRIASILRDSGATWVDNRTLFDQSRQDTTLPIEQRWLAESGRLPVHPNAKGHRQIAETTPPSWLTRTFAGESGG